MLIAQAKGEGKTDDSEEKEEPQTNVLDSLQLVNKTDIIPAFGEFTGEFTIKSR